MFKSDLEQEQLSRSRKSRESSKQNSQKSRKDNRKFKFYCRIRSNKGEVMPSGRKVKSFQKENSQTVAVIDSSEKKQKMNLSNRKFNFEGVFEDESQVQIFQETTLDLIENLIQSGRSSLLIANGISHSGKSYTITGDNENPGILPLTLKYFYDRLSQNKEKNWDMHCNYVEIDGDAIYDLLSPEGKLAQLKQNDLSGVTKYKLEEIEDFSGALNMGNKRKKMNKSSSLTHTAFKIVLGKKDQTVESSITILDLAVSDSRDYPDLSQNLNLLDNKEEEFDRIYSSQYSLCRLIQELSDNQKVKKGAINNLEMSSPLLSFLKYYFFTEFDISLITTINYDLENFEENIKILTFSEKFRNFLFFIVEYFEKYKVNFEKLLGSRQNVKAELNLIEEEKVESVDLSSIEKFPDQSTKLEFSDFIPNSELERMKKDYSELLKKFEEQTKLINRLLDEKSTNPSKIEDKIVNKNVFDVTKIFEEIKYDNLSNPNSRNLNVIFISPSIQTFNLTNSTNSPPQEKVNHAPEVTIEVKKVEREDKSVDSDSTNQTNQPVLPEEKLILEKNNIDKGIKSNFMSNFKNILDHQSPKKGIKMEAQSEEEGTQSFFKSFDNLKRRRNSKQKSSQKMRKKRQFGQKKNKWIS